MNTTSIGSSLQALSVKLIKFTDAMHHVEHDLTSLLTEHDDERVHHQASQTHLTQQRAAQYFHALAAQHRRQALQAELPERLDELCTQFQNVYDEATAQDPNVFFELYLEAHTYLEHIQYDLLAEIGYDKPILNMILTDDFQSLLGDSEAVQTSYAFAKKHLEQQRLMFLNKASKNPWKALCKQERKNTPVESETTTPFRTLSLFLTKPKDIDKDQEHANTTTKLGCS